eukprot:6968736-Lingulodinium_polyedra.AAC.1
MRPISSPLGPKFACSSKPSSSFHWGRARGVYCRNRAGAPRLRPQAGRCRERPHCAGPRARHC